ncbi:MAG TPA: cytidylate kinase-like family protein [Ramlibacter sp.]|uniref:cytidylate kinase-like family protein n=1 Tax=Ramlibacter sp. TaxID=1917967 RepID=UPI002C7DDC37|nr:cytidylate kinase-like family protein [Ramlibacter sp.]HVZ44897.1 cytidylate kinase-like family protein [Ramlibacter sp.]
MGLRAICISRAIWVGAEEIAADVARELGFRCVDEEILKVAAEKRNLDPSVVADAERRKSFLANFVADIRRGGMGELINYIPGQRTLPTESDDIRVVIRDAILETANEGSVVIVAHAASYVLGPRKDVLRVLITGSPLARAKRWLAKSGGKSPREAAETIQASDQARAHYLKRFYDVDSEAPEHYDIVLSTDKLATEQITQLVLQAARALDTSPVAAESGWGDLPGAGASAG